MTTYKHKVTVSTTTGELVVVLPLIQDKLFGLRLPYDAQGLNADIYAAAETAVNRFFNDFATEGIVGNYAWRTSVDVVG